MDINEKDISFKKITNNTFLEGKKQVKHMFSKPFAVGHTYKYTTVKCEIFYKSKSTGLFWGLPSLIDGYSTDLLNTPIDMEMIKNAIANWLNILEDLNRENRKFKDS